MAPKREPLTVKFARLHTVDASGCWLWNGSKTSTGYGQLKTGRAEQSYAHRWSFEYYRYPIPDGMQLDHLCRSRSCVNPQHLEPVTPQINSERGAMSWTLTGFCREGVHDMTDSANIYVAPSGYRRCHPCAKAKDNERKRRGRGRAGAN